MAAAPLRRGVLAAGSVRLPAARAALLDEPRNLPAPDWLDELALAPGELPAATTQLRAALASTGVVRVRLSATLTTDQLVRFGESLGQPMPEAAPAVAPFVERGVVLNLVAAHRRAPDADREPFSEEPIRLHSESSAVPVSGQPRYLCFHCVHAASLQSGGQTVLVPMAAVSALLGERARWVLAATSYDRPGQPPPILRREGDREVFCFRDFGAEPLAWRCTAELSEEDVNAELRALLDALYQAQPVYGLSWAENDLVVLDNRVFFHGRNACRVRPAGRPRHLRRLRLVAADRAADPGHPSTRSRAAAPGGSPTRAAEE